MRQLSHLNLQFRPAGDFACDLESSHGPWDLLRPLWSASESFGVVRQVPARVDLGSSGLKKVRATSKALSLLPVDASRALAYWAAEWPGTRARDSFVILIGRPVDADFNTVSSNSSLLGAGFEGWEDLFLFSGTELHYYCCTHEHFGAVYGSREMLARFGSKVRRIDERDSGLSARGDLIDGQTWSALTSTAS